MLPDDELLERLEQVAAMFRAPGVISAIIQLLEREECTSRQLFGAESISPRHRSQKGKRLGLIVNERKEGREYLYWLREDMRPWIEILVRSFAEIGKIAFAEEPSTDRTRAHAIILGNLRAFGVQDLILEDGVIIAGKKRIKICPDCQTFIYVKKRLDFAGLVALLVPG